MPSSKVDFDIAIIGNGLAGASLLQELFKQPQITDLKICLFEKRDYTHTLSRTISFWTQKTENTSTTPGFKHQWSNLQQQSIPVKATNPILNEYQLTAIDNQKFCEQILTEAKGLDNFSYKNEKVEKIELNSPDFDTVVTEKNVYTAKWVFDSRSQPIHLPQKKEINLYQQFIIWNISTKQSAFNPENAVFFDFQQTNPNQFDFFYLLPYSNQSAYIAYVRYQQIKEIPVAEFTENLTNYCQKVLQLDLQDYRIDSQEFGFIPLQSRHWFRQTVTTPNVLMIGTAAGQIKASTGYAFSNIQKDSKRIVSSLLKPQNPYKASQKYEKSLKKRILDKMDYLILQLIASDPAYAKEIFKQMFSKNELKIILKFLDEEISYFELLKFIWTFPKLFFLWFLLNHL